MGKPFTGSYPITAGKYYSSGARHYATDYGCPIGTPVLSIGTGVVGAIHDGVDNNVPGHNPGSSSPSNFIVVYTEYQGKPAYVYYQHLNKGLSVKVGQKLTEGQVIAHSGNTGNSSGPHLHVATGWGHPDVYHRYDYMKDEFLIYPPSLLMVSAPKEDDMPEYMSVSQSVDFDLKDTDDWKTLSFDKESSDDDDQHADGNYPTILTDKCLFVATFNISLAHILATSVVGSSLLIRYVKYNEGDKTTTPYPYEEVPLIGGGSAALMTMNGVMADAQRLRVQAKLVGVPSVKVTDYDCRIMYWPL